MLRPLAVQLYSLREWAADDFIAVLKKVADIGYVAVEPAGFWNIRPSDFKNIIADLGLKMFSSHTPWATPQTLGQSMDMADTLDLNRIACGYEPADFADMDAIKRSADTTNKMQEVLEQNGFTLFQHNHNFEFERIDDKLKYQIYAELCQKVKFEIDTFWAANFGKENPAEMLKLFADRTILIHLKDGLLEESQVNENGWSHAEMRALGTGQMDLKSVIANLPDAVDNIVVELDHCNIDMVEAIEKSYKYLTENSLTMGNK